MSMLALTGGLRDPESSCSRALMMLATPSNSSMVMIGRDEFLRSARIDTPAAVQEWALAVAAATAAACEEDSAVASAAVEDSVVAVAVSVSVAVAVSPEALPAAVVPVVSRLLLLAPSRPTLSPTLPPPELREARLSLFET